MRTLSAEERAKSHAMYSEIIKMLNTHKPTSEMTFAIMGTVLSQILLEDFSKPEAHRMVDEFAKITHTIITTRSNSEESKCKP